MIRCSACQTANLDTSRFCDECGSRLIASPPVEETPQPAYVPPPSASSFSRPVSVTSLGVPPVAFEPEPATPLSHVKNVNSGSAHASLMIERGDGPGTEYRLVSDESTIGRWDADNGIFPDVDLDAHDSDAKVSRRHARIIRNNGGYFIEDLGSTNGTYVNRGRRLLPGNAQLLNDGDEVIVGKTFLRFKIID
ncbi:MAG TPA: FHA domain-containing protein [Pyrinomonadaceae bacterium]|nr:FHA domain-containing protein [Pyrinomonadaceae bacterium]